MAKQPLGGRPNKAALAKMKVVTVVVSVAAFVGSLGAVAYLTPGIAGTVHAQTQSPNTLGSTGSTTALASSAPLRFRSRQQQASAAPLTRTRGS